MYQINRLFVFHYYISFFHLEVYEKLFSSSCLTQEQVFDHRQLNIIIHPALIICSLLFCDKRNGEFCDDIGLQIRVELSRIWTRKLFTAFWDDLIHSATLFMNYLSYKELALGKYAVC